MKKMTFVAMSCLTILSFHCSNQCDQGRALKNWTASLDPTSPTDGKDPQVSPEKDGIVLKLADSRNQESAKIISKLTITGDFTIQSSFRDLTTDVPGVALQITAIPTEGNGFSVDGHVIRSGSTGDKLFFAETGYTVPQGGTDPGYQAALSETSVTSGTIQLKRVGSTITVTITPDGESPVEKAYPNFGTLPVRIETKLASVYTIPTQTSGATSSVKISEVQAMPEAGVASEKFSCDSLE